MKDGRAVAELGPAPCRGGRTRREYDIHSVRRREPARKDKVARLYIERSAAKNGQPAFPVDIVRPAFSF